MMSRLGPAGLWRLFDKSQNAAINPAGERHENKRELLTHSLPGMVPEGNEVVPCCSFVRKPLME
jgi:hypothetical protein